MRRKKYKNFSIKNVRKDNNDNNYKDNRCKNKTMTQKV